MSIGHLLDHTCNVWRLITSLGPFRETVNEYEKVYEGLDCTNTRRNTVFGQSGPGLRPVGDRNVYLDTGPLFQDRDVVELVSGPTGFVGPQLLEVESFAIPRGHHIELRCSEFKGELTVAGDEDEGGS
jgi:hypothetical protein